jgi:transposase
MRHTPSPSKRGLRKRDRVYLQSRLRSAATPIEHQRIRAVLLIAEGSTVAEAAETVGLSRPCVNRWLGCYLRERRGCTFRDAARSGRPAIDLSLEDDQLIALVRQSPISHGYMSTGWTLALLRQHLCQSHDVDIGPDALRQRLHQIGLRWKRPRYVFAESEPYLAQKKGG